MSRFVGQKLLISFLSCLLLLRIFSHKISETCLDTDLVQALCVNHWRGKKTIFETVWSKSLGNIIGLLFLYRDTIWSVANIDSVYRRLIHVVWLVKLVNKRYVKSNTNRIPCFRKIPSNIDTPHIYIHLM